MKNKEGKTFERELPKGYKVALAIDAKDKKIGLIFNVIAIISLIVIMAIASVPLLLNKERLLESEYYYSIAIYLFVLMIAYIIIHELVHGIAYKISTGEKLTFGLTLTCAFCGVPKIFTYRKTALAAVLAPTIVLSLVMLPLMVVYYFINAYTYLMLALIFAMHLGGCCCDIYIAYLLLVKYKDDRTLMNDTGPKMTLLVYDEASLESYDEATQSFVDSFNQAEDTAKDTEEKRKKKEKNAFAISIITIVVLSLGALLMLAITVNKYTGLMLYEEAPRFYKLVSLYMTVSFVIGIVYCVATMKKHGGFKALIAVLLIIFAFPILFIAAAQGSTNISHTTDIENYGIYDYPEKMPDFFPKEITEEMTPVKFSYYYDNSWDWCYELYLEVKMTEQEYDSYKSQYSGKLVACWYADSYTEYVMKDCLNLYEGEEYDYASNPDIKKIIFNDKDKTVIFWTMYGLDPFYFENSAFFERFSIEPRLYEEQTAKKNK